MTSEVRPLDLPASAGADSAAFWDAARNAWAARFGRP